MKLEYSDHIDYVLLDVGYTDRISKVEHLLYMYRKVDGLQLLAVGENYECVPLFADSNTEKYIMSTTEKLRFDSGVVYDEKIQQLLYNIVVGADVKWVEHSSVHTIMNAIDNVMHTDGVLFENTRSIQDLECVINEFQHCGCLNDPYMCKEVEVKVNGGITKTLQIYKYDTKSG